MATSKTAPSPSRSALPEPIAAPLRLVLVVVRRAIEIGLLALFVALLALFALQLPHPPGWDRVILVQLLHRTTDPVVSAAAGALGFSWPVSGFSAFPFVLALVVWMVRGITAHRVELLRRRIARKAPEYARTDDAQRAWLAKAAGVNAAEETQLVEADPTLMDGTEGMPDAEETSGLPSATPTFLERAAAEFRRPAEATIVPRMEPTVAEPGEPLPKTVMGSATSLGRPRVSATPRPAPAPAPAPSAGAGAGAGGDDFDNEEDPTLDGRLAPRKSRVTAHHVPTKIGRYNVIQELGRGAMGVVYKAEDPTIGRQVAIKTILSANLADESAEQFKKRFTVEARAIGKLSHPGIVALHDVTEDEAGQPSMVMEFVEGQTLESLVEGGRRPSAEQAVDIIAQVADALAYAHASGVIHRDIKPANIMVTRNGEAKVSDFGVAKLADTQLTSTGQVLGTPAYMSPEQFNTSSVDARSDLFSLGSVLYFALTGEKPFPGDTITAIGYKVMFVDPLPVAQLNPALPASLDDIVSRCLRKNPGERFATAREMAKELRSYRTRGAASVDSTRPDLS